MGLYERKNERREKAGERMEERKKASRPQTDKHDIDKHKHSTAQDSQRAERRSRFEAGDRG